MPPSELTCDNCGACCMHSVVPPFDYDGAEDRLAKLPSELRATLQLRPDEDEDAPCRWFDPASGRCRHYEHRPQACRDFKIDSVACRGVRKLHQLAS